MPPIMSEDTPDILKEMRDELRELREEVAELRASGSDSGQLLTREEAADRLRISTRTLDDMRDMGEIKATKIRGRVLYHPDTIDAYIRRQTG